MEKSLNLIVQIVWEPCVILYMLNISTEVHLVLLDTALSQYYEAIVVFLMKLFDVCLKPVLLEFRAREGRDPESEHAESDRAKLKALSGEVLKSLGIPVDHLDDDFHR